MKPLRSSLIRQAIMVELDRHEQAIDTEPDLRCFAMLVYLHNECIEHVEVRKNSDTGRTAPRSGRGRKDGIRYGNKTQV